jgi:hypothetical protein
MIWKKVTRKKLTIYVFHIYYTPESHSMYNEWLCPYPSYGVYRHFQIIFVIWWLSVLSLRLCFRLPFMHCIYNILFIGRDVRKSNIHFFEISCPPMTRIMETTKNTKLKRNTEWLCPYPGYGVYRHFQKKIGDMVAFCFIITI